jgi:hypothetical protein
VIKSESKLDSETSSNKSSAKLSLDGNFCSGSINSPLSCKYINFFLSIFLGWGQDGNNKGNTILEHNTIEIINFICSTHTRRCCLFWCRRQRRRKIYGGNLYFLLHLFLPFSYFDFFIISFFSFFFFSSVGNLLSDNC